MFSWNESDVEDALVEKLEVQAFADLLYIGRQIDIGVGIVDILAYNTKTKELVVIEIKKDQVDESALGQIMRYMAGIEDYVEKLEHLEVFGVKGMLVGRTIRESVKASLRFIQDWIVFWEYNLEVSIDLGEARYSRNKSSGTYNPKKFEEDISSPILEWVEEDEAMRKYYEEKEKVEQKKGETNGKV